MKRLPSASTYAVWLAFVRIVTGIMWLSHGIPKFVHGDTFMPPNGFIGAYVSKGLQQTTGFYHDFLAGVVQPNLSLFAELVRLGEVLTGVLLVLGLFTRFGGLLGMFLPLNYVLARGELLSSSALQSVDFSMFVLSAISLVLPTGRAIGVDALLGRPKQRIPKVQAEFVPEPPIMPPPGPTTSTNP